MAVPYKLNYFEIETGINSTSTFIHTGDFTATKVKKYLATSNDILLGDGTTVSLSSLATLTSFSATSPLLYNNTTGVFSIPVATSIANGYLSSADWITFNAKQATITLTTTGTSGAATFISNVLNIPQYTDAFVGTVTSVAALTLGTTGTDLSSTVANSTTTPVITLNVPTASATNRGALSSSDWTTFNNKQAAGNYITSLTGEATASGPGASSVTLDNTAVIGKVLTGLNVTGGTVISTDSILSAFGKVQNQINGLVGGSIFQGTWDASTNTPALTSSVGTNGYYYIVSVDGSTNLNGITDWKVGDWAIFAGTAWQKVDNTDSVASVNGYTGTVSLVTGDVLEGAGSLPSRPSQLYFTDARARAAISLTTSGSSGASTYDSATGVLNIPNYLQDLSGYVTLATSQTITADKTFTTSGNTDTLTINHSSGTGIGLSITKGGNGEGIYVNKTSGSGNAATIIGTLNATTLVKSGGTSSQFLKADGTVDGTAYTALNGTGIVEMAGTTPSYLSSTGTGNVVKATSPTLVTPALGTPASGVMTNVTGTAAGLTAGLIVNQANSATIDAAATNVINSIALRDGNGDIFTRTFNMANNYGDFAPNKLVGTSSTGQIREMSLAQAQSYLGYGTGSVTSVAALTLGTSGTDLSSTVANGSTTPVITLNVPDASATARGVVTTGTQTFAGAKTFASVTVGGRILGTGNLSSDIATFENTASVGFGLKVQGASGSNYAFQVNDYLGTNLFNVLGNGNVSLTSLTNGLIKSTSGVLSNASSADLNTAGVVLTTTDQSIAGVKTFTGALSGTSGTFSGTIRSDSDFRVVKDGDNTLGNGSYHGWYNTAITRGWVAQLSGSNHLYFGYYDGSTWSLKQTLSNDGGATLTGALSGTSATFSSSATATAFIPSGATIPTNGMYLSAANTLDFSTNSLNRLSITSGGNVGIGTTSNLDLGVVGTVALSVGGSTAYGGIQIRNSTGNLELFVGGANATDALIRNNMNGDLRLGTSGTEHMRITSGGAVLVGRYTTGLNNTSGTTISGGSIQVEEAGYVFYGNRTTSDGLFMGIRRNNVDVGSITVTTSATAFNTSSDYRLKTDFKDYNGLNLINSIKTYDYAWVIDNTRAYGVKAHELAEVIPNAVFGEKDEINDDGSVKSQAVDYSKLVPILIKSIQELNARIIQLENK
jgi:hypothetical protein